VQSPDSTPVVPVTIVNCGELIDRKDVGSIEIGNAYQLSGILQHLLIHLILGFKLFLGHLGKVGHFCIYLLNVLLM